MEILKEYEQKKETIKQRLNDFTKITNDEELFYELCFCILTPQSRAKLCWKAIEDLKKNDFLHKEINPLTYLLGRTRFQNNKSRYLLEAKSKYNEIISNLKTLNPVEMREWLVTNIKGIGLKEASLPYFEKIIVIIDSKPKFIEIGDFVDNYEKGNYNKNKLETFSFNSNTLKFEIQPITHVFKHNYKNDLFEILLETGRKVFVTGDHSLFTVSKGEIIPLATNNLNKNDFIAIPRKLPILNTNLYSVNLVK